MLLVNHLSSAVEEKQRKGNDEEERRSIQGRGYQARPDSNSVFHNNETTSVGRCAQSIDYTEPEERKQVIVVLLPARQLVS